MKPDEIDRLFRDELEKLDHVPGVEWNDTTPWNKVSDRLKGGGSKLWTWTFSTLLVFFSLYLIYRVPTPPVTPQEGKKNLATATRQIKVDTLTEMDQAVATPERVRIKPKATLVVSQDSTVTESADTLSLISETGETISLDRNFNSIVQRHSLINTSLPNAKFKFSMPRVSYLHFEIKESFNFRDLNRSIDAANEEGKNFNLSYKYNKSYVPPMFENSHPRYVINSSTYPYRNR